VQSAEEVERKWKGKGRRSEQRKRGGEERKGR
jgi:hypothetical protein